MDGARVIIDSIIEKILDYLVEAVCTAIIGLLVGCLWPHIVRETQKVIYSRYLLIKKSRGIDQLVKRAPLLDYKDFESRKSVFEEIMKALKDERRRVIGIWGMGGVGKTTMVKMVGDLAKKEHTFDEVLLAVVSQNPVVSNIQGQLADKLGKKLQRETVQGRADELRTGLLKDEKKILVILDDIWDELDLEEIGIPFADGRKGIRILLTSRKQTVCHAMQDPNPIFIQQLSEEEAWNLFRKKVGNPIKSHDIPPDLAQQVCRKCRGLPVAILAVAGALKSEDKEIWDNALKQLNTYNLKKIEGVNKKVCASLMFSYNQLESEDTKSCFLFCCLFPEDFDIPIELLMRLGIGTGFLGDMKKLKLGEARNRVYDLVDKLKDYSLLLEGKDKEHVKMHDVVRDVAISIASQGQFLIETDLEEWPEQETSNSYTAISLLYRSIGIQEIPDGWECPKLHTLMLRCSYYYGDFYIPGIFFDGMKKLKVLFLEAGKIIWLPPSIQNLNNLRVLHLKCWKSGDITLIGKLKRLEMLILRCSGVHVLPTKIGDLTRLRLLDLRGCTELNFISPSVISNLSKLEDLFLPMKSKMFWGCGGIENHEKCADLSELIPLSRLETLEICVPKFEMWPKERFSPFLANLTSFKISINSVLMDVECGAWKKILKLKSVPLRCEVDVLLKKAEALYISRCEGVQEFMVNVLERQYLLERQSHLRSFSKLGVLKIKKCNFKYLLSPSAAKVLVQLEELTIKDCENVEAIVGRYEVASTGGDQAEDTVDRVIGFSSLKHLWLENLPKLVGFYPKMERTSGLGESLQFPVQPLFNEKVAFPELEELIIDDAGGCKEIGLHFPAQESFSKLRRLRVDNMNGLSTIGSSTLIPRLQSLQELRIEYCGSLRAVFAIDNDEVFARRRLLSSLALHKAVQFLKPLGMGPKCSNPVFIGQLPALQSLVIRKCDLLDEFCCDSGPRSKEATNTARPFFSHRIGFPELRELWLREMKKVKEIWGEDDIPPPRSFCNLTRLFIENCPKLERVIPPVILPRLLLLEGLEVSICESVREVIEVVGVGSEDVVVEKEKVHGAFSVLPKLNEIRLKYLQNLEHLPWGKTTAAGGGGGGSVSSPPSSFLAFQSLSRIEIINCGRLRNLFSSSSTALAFTASHNLRILHIEGCKKMEEIVGKEVGAAAASNHAIQIIFPQLEELNLVNLPNLTSFCPASYLLFQQSSLKNKRVRHCPKLHPIPPPE